MDFEDNAVERLLGHELALRHFGLVPPVVFAELRLHAAHQFVGAVLVRRDGGRQRAGRRVRRQVLPRHLARRLDHLQLAGRGVHFLARLDLPQVQVLVHVRVPLLRVRLAPRLRVRRLLGRRQQVVVVLLRVAQRVLVRVVRRQPLVYLQVELGDLVVPLDFRRFRRRFLLPCFTPVLPVPPPVLFPLLLRPVGCLVEGNPASEVPGNGRGQYIALLQLFFCYHQLVAEMAVENVPFARRDQRK